MVIYDLICDSQHGFEGWFKNSEDLESQQANDLLRCPICDSPRVHKKVAAPKLARKSNASSASDAKTENRAKARGVSRAVASTNEGSAKAYARVQKMLTKVHEFIDSNFEDVGNKFADEALKMHKGEKQVTNIRGIASADEIKDLADQGVDTLPLPARPVDKKKLN